MATIGVLHNQHQNLLEKRFLIVTQCMTSLIMIFGATGDLAKRKLFPSLYRLFEKGRLSDEFAVVGVARRPLSNDEFQSSVKESVRSALGKDEKIDEFASHFYYHSHDVTDSRSYLSLKKMTNDLDEHYGLEENR